LCGGDEGTKKKERGSKFGHGGIVNRKPRFWQ
jgi:hypothetical protein